MIHTFLSVLSREILLFLKKNPEFFTEKEKARTELLEHVRIPAPFKDYLAARSEKDFLNDLNFIFKTRNGSSAEFKDQPFFMALLGFFTTLFASKLDKVPVAFNLDSTDKQKDFLTELLGSETPIAEVIKQILMTYTQQDLSLAISEFSRHVANAPLVLIQSPREIEPELKSQIRHEFLNEYPNSFPIFQINRSLIGGMRVFVNGEVVDHSWIYRVIRFTTLTTS